MKILKKPEERDEPSGGWLHSKIRKEVINLCKNVKGRLIEVGCGEGLFITKLAVSNSRLEIYGLDNNIDKILAAQRRCQEKKLKNIKLIYSDGVDFPSRNESFDMIVCINTFVNINSIDTVIQVLTQMTRVCKKGGRIIFDLRNSLNPLIKLKYKLAPYYDATIREEKLPLNTYNPKCIEEILGKLNLKIINKIFIGFPKNILAPIVIIEAERC